MMQEVLNMLSIANAQANPLRGFRGTGIHGIQDIGGGGDGIGDI